MKGKDEDEAMRRKWEGGWDFLFTLLFQTLFSSWAGLYDISCLMGPLRPTCLPQLCVHIENLMDVSKPHDIGTRDFVFYRLYLRKCPFSRCVLFFLKNKNKKKEKKKKKILEPACPSCLLCKWAKIPYGPFFNNIGPFKIIQK